MLLFVDGESLVGPFGFYALYVFDVGGSGLAVVLCDFVSDHIVLGLSVYKCLHTLLRVLHSYSAWQPPNTFLFRELQYFHDSNLLFQ